MNVQFGAIVMIPRTTEDGHHLTPDQRRHFGEELQREFPSVRRSGNEFLNTDVVTHRGDVFFVTGEDLQVLRSFEYLKTRKTNQGNATGAGLLDKMVANLFAAARQANESRSEADLWGKGFGGQDGCPIVTRKS